MGQAQLALWAEDTTADAHQFSNRKHENIGKQTQTCFQRILREQRAKEEKRPVIHNLDGCRIQEVSSEQARFIIKKYEWLGTMGRPQFCVGLLSRNGELLGVACFGLPGSRESRNICGEEYAKEAICLERGACVPHAPPNAASFLISQACRVAVRKGFRVVYAYADEDAGEIGTVYQACNWIYIGQGVGRSPGRKREYYRHPKTGETIASRTLRHRGWTKNGIISMGWEVILQAAKHKYVWFGGRRKHELLSRMRYPQLPYPKRTLNKKNEDDLA